MSIKPEQHGASGLPTTHLTESQRCALVQDIDLSDEAGVRYLKQLPIKRSMRRRLLTSRWIVNLFSGEGEHSDLRALEENGLVLLEMDLKKSRAFNLRDPSPAYRALLWAAMRGQLEGIFGGPTQKKRRRRTGAEAVLPLVG